MLSLILVCSGAVMNTVHAQPASSPSLKASYMDTVSQNLIPRKVKGSTSTLNGSITFNVVYDDYYGWGFDSVKSYNLYLTGPYVGYGWGYESLEVESVTYKLYDYGKSIDVRIKGQVRENGFFCDDLYPFDETYTFDYYGY